MLPIGASLLVEVLGGTMKGYYGWPAELIRIAIGAPYSMPHGFVVEVFLEKLGPPASGLIVALLVLSLAYVYVWRASWMRRIFSSTPLDRSWKRSLVSAVFTQLLTGQWGVDSYIIGFPFPFFDSSVSGMMLEGPSTFSFIALVLSVALTAVVCHSTIAVWKRVRRQS